ncbi:MAG: cellobiose phosphorylase, partial [Byssovorax cruenta]
MVQSATRVDQVLFSQRDHLISQLAEELRGSKARKTPFLIPARLKELDRFFQHAYSYFNQPTQAQIAVSNASEWLLDNFHIMEQAVRVVQDDLPADYYSRLPKTAEGLARIYVIAMAINEDAPRLDAEQIQNFIQTFQKTSALQVGELWALPLLLRLAILETLADGLAEITKLKLSPAVQSPIWTRIISSSNSTGADAETKVINSIINLRLIANIEWKEFFEATSILEKILRRDPTNLYTHCDFDTRNQYRNVIEELAYGSAVEEKEVAEQAIALAEASTTIREKHVGYYLIAQGRRQLERQVHFHPSPRQHFLTFLRSHPTPIYLGTIGFLTLVILSGVLLYAMGADATRIQLAIIALLAVIPVSVLAVDLVNWLVGLIIPPQTLPKLNFESGIPVQYRTMVVIPALLGTERDIAFLMRQLELHYVANTDPNLFFALLSDFADADEKDLPEDPALIALATAEIDRLNERYGAGEYRPFYLFHRERLWNAGENSWMGWERKRGKLEEFNELLQGSQDTSYKYKHGDLSILPSIHFVITLDADTWLPRDSARRLVGTLAHVLNRAELDPATGEVKAGYTVLQPRAQVRPAIVNQSIFTRVYAGDAIIDLYSRAVSDVYQDLFGEGNFVGKGIYDVEAFEKSLRDKVPENHLLSHDLFEALQGSCGLVSDIVLFEDYPPHYVAYTDRLNRWVRGDWQLLPWLGRWVPHRAQGKVLNTLSLIDRWRIFDNLRRSLIVPSVLLLLISGWLLLPGSPFAWTVFALSPYLLPLLLNLISELRRGAHEPDSRLMTRPMRLAALRSLFQVVFLPHEALIYLDAILTTLARLYVSHRNMLQWMTAAHTVQLFGRRLRVKSAWQAMLTTPLIAIGLAFALYFEDERVITLALPFLVAWIFSPNIAARISKPDVHEEVKITPAQEKKLHLLARSTWLYFEHFVSPEDRWLPPDHFQEDPRGLVQHQTSPTNIGLMLLSTMAAHDMGYMGTLELSLRIRDTFDSMDSLERMRGHFLNWYDTRTSAPLLPRYISTVDSGNLAACLLTLKQGCLEIGRRPVVHWQGFIDTIDMLSFVLEESSLDKSSETLKEALRSINTLAEQLKNPETFSPTLLAQLFGDEQTEFETMLWDAMQTSADEVPTESLRKLSTWVQRLRYQLRHLRTDLQLLAPWLLALADVPTLSENTNSKAELVNAWNELLATLSLQPTLGAIPQVCESAASLLEQIMDLLEAADTEAFNWCEVLAYDLQAAKKFSSSLLSDFSTLVQRAETFFEEMNFNFLYDPNRRVFHIGYNAESGRLDSNYYDLLASEARIASLIAIARGDVPQSHWLYLARPLTEFDGKRALLSWSGTMFEYLMPNLFVESYPNTLIDQSSRIAVEQQIEYASEKKIPWGISESSYYNFDAAQIY